MSIINLEVMQQLVHEFMDKEALVAAEINVVQKQIDELGERIDSCRQRLTTVSQDKEKITVLLKRYAGDAAFLSVSGTNAPPIAAQSEKGLILEQSQAVFTQPIEKNDIVQAKDDSFLQTQAASAKVVDSKPVAEDIPAAEITPPARTRRSTVRASQLQITEPQQDSSVANPQAAESNSTSLSSPFKSSESEQPPKEKPITEETPPADAAAEDDAVKSINEALRGLFR